MVWAKSGNPGKDPLRDRRDDLYETPPEAVYALLKAESLPKAIWEPCAGSGAIVKILRDAGHSVFASDLQDLGCPYSTPGIDFLMCWQPPIGIDAIVTNPPYKLANEFIRHAIPMVPRVIMLLRLAYLEGSERSDILDGYLARVYLFRNRLPRMHRAGWTGKKATSMMAFAWFVFEEKHAGPISLRRISWQKNDPVSAC